MTHHTTRSERSRLIPDWHRIKGRAEDFCRLVPVDLMGQLCFTSPPYWMLRDYGHPDQLGMEETPEEYCQKLAVILRDIGARMFGCSVMCVVIGDTYFGGGSTTKKGNDFAKYKDKSTLAGTHPGGSIRPVKPQKHQRIRVGEQIGIPWMLANEMRNNGWMIRQVCVWHKPNPMPAPFRGRFTCSHESIIIATKATWPHYKCNRPALDDGHRIARDVITQSVSHGGHKHSAGFPVELAKLFIAAYTDKGQTVFDPFAGSGTTEDACFQLGRRCVSVDINGVSPNSPLPGAKVTTNNQQTKERA
jgi:hypothetical protein